MSLLFQNATLVLPQTVIQADLQVTNGQIQQIAPTIAPGPETQVIDARGRYLLPGFVDTHTHGTMGFDFSLGVYDEGAQQFRRDPKSLEAGLGIALEAYLRQGTTRLFATTLAAPLEVLTESFAGLNAFLQQYPETWAHLVAGIHLEGTFLKLPAFAGAQNSAHFFPPSRETFAQLQDASGQRLRLVILPPEHGPAGWQFTRELVAQDIVVGSGHSGATADEFYQAVEAGLSLGIHFLNGPSFSSSKPFHNGGAVEAMLRSDQVQLELIADGYHVHPSYFRDVIGRKGFDRVHIITDSMFATGKESIRQFEVAGIMGARSANGAYLQVIDRSDKLFGSALQMDKGYENVLNWLTQDMEGVWHRHHPAYSLEEALTLVSRLASSNPARLMGLADTGEIAVGKTADLVLADLAETDAGFRLRIDSVCLQGTLFPFESR